MTTSKSTLVLDDLDAVAKPGRAIAPRDLDAVSSEFHHHASRQAAARGGRKKAMGVPRTPEHGDATFQTTTQPSTGPVRVLMQAQVRNGHRLKSTVSVPLSLQRRLTVAAPGSKNQALVGLADWALTELERQGKLLHVQAEVVDESFVPDNVVDFTAPGNKLPLSEIRLAAVRMAEALHVAQFDVTAKAHCIASLVAALERQEAVIRQLHELLGPAAVQKAKLLKLDPVPSDLIVSEAEHEAQAKAEATAPQSLAAVKALLAGE